MDSNNITFADLGLSEEMLKALEAKKKVLIVLPEKDEKAILSARNIPGVKTTFSGIICVYDILKADKLVVGKAAVEKIQEVYAK